MSRYSPNVTAGYLCACADHNPDGEVMVYGERRTSWRGLARRVFRLANALLQLGVRPGEKVAFVLHNCPEFVEVNYACQVAGAIPAPLSYRYTARELRAQLAHSDARLLIFEEAWAGTAERALRELGDAAPRAVRLGGGSGPSGALPYEALLAAGDDADPRVPTRFEDVAAMLYTGGTTGLPKGALLTYGGFIEMFARLVAALVRQVGKVELSAEQRAHLGAGVPVAAARALLPLLRFAPVRRWLARERTEELTRAALRYALPRPELVRLGYGATARYQTPSMPYFHSASYQMLMLGLVTGNLCFIMTPGTSFDPVSVLETAQRERTAFLANVPAGWKMLLACPGLDRYDLSSIRIAASGTAPCSAALKREIFARLPGVVIIDLFGQTEMTPVTAFRLDTSPAQLKERAVGCSIVETRVIDESGQEVAPDVVGEICYRSGSAMRGYYKEEARTAEVMAGGWLRSGDLGFRDAEGELHLLDRKNDCINTGGEKVSPLEVEEVLQRHPQVEEACVFGVPDERWGSAVRAAVRCHAHVDEGELLALCREHLAGYKVPKMICFVSELPRSAVGKVLRAEVRERALRAAPKP